MDELGLDDFKKNYPQYELAPFFTRWEDFFEESKASVWVSALARCKAGRLAHIEPVHEQGEFTTHPLVLEGSRLVLNAHTLAGGSIRAELQDAEGNVFPGLSLGDSVPFSGDEVEGVGSGRSLPQGGEDTRRTRQGTPLLVSNRSIRRSAIVARDHDIDVTAFYLATPSRIQVMIQTRRGGGSGPVVGLVVKGSGGS